MRKPHPAIPPLFLADPEENFNRWMQSCLPGASLARADAIREWLAKPVEARVQRSNDHRAEAAKLQAPQTAPPESSGASEAKQWNGTCIIETKRLSAQNTQPIDSFTEHPFEGGLALPVGKQSRYLLKLAVYLVFALLILKVGGERRSVKIAVPSDATIARTQGGNDPTAASRLVPGDAPIGISPNTGPTTTIQSLSVACQEAPSCIEISTSGHESRLRLSTLSGPDRVVMKFQDTVFSSTVPVMTAGHGLVKAVRTGWDASKPRDVTVVIDLRGKCNYDLHTASNKVVVILRKATVHQARL